MANVWEQIVEHEKQQAAAPKPGEGSVWARIAGTQGKKVKKPQLNDLPEIGSYTRPWRTRVDHSTMRDLGLMEENMNAREQNLSALDAYIQAAERNVRLTENYYRQAQTDESRQMYEDAFAAYERAIAQQNAEAKNYNEMAEVTRRTAQNQYRRENARALEQYQALSQLGSFDEQGNYTLNAGYGDIQARRREAADQLDQTTDRNERARQQRTIDLYTQLLETMQPENAEQSGQRAAEIEARIAALQSEGTERVWDPSARAPLASVAGYSPMQYREQYVRQAEIDALQRELQGLESGKRDLLYQTELERLPEELRRQVTEEYPRLATTMEAANNGALSGEFSTAAAAAQEITKALRAQGYSAEQVNGILRYARQQQNARDVGELAAEQQERAAGRNSEYDARLEQLPEELRARLLEDYPRLAERAEAARGGNGTAPAAVFDELSREAGEIETALRAQGYGDKEIRELMRYAAERGTGRSTAANLAANVGWGLMSGAQYFDILMQGISNPVDPFTGEKTPVDYNSQAAYALGQATMQGQQEKVLQRYLDRFDGDKEKAEARTRLNMGAYQLAVSMGQSAVIAGLSALGMPAATLILGSSAATATAQEYHEQGYSDRAALAMGLIAGTVETITEKYSLDKLLDEPKKLAGKKGREWLMTALKNTGGQMLAEGSEEVASDVLNTLADVILLGDQSQYLRGVEAIMEDNPGMSRQAAEQKAFVDWVWSTVQSGIGGAVSGALFGVGGSLVGAAVNARSGQTGAEGPQRAGAVQIEQETPPGLQQEYDDLTAAYRAATERNDQSFDYRGTLERMRTLRQQIDDYNTTNNGGLNNGQSVGEGSGDRADGIRAIGEAGAVPAEGAGRAQGADAGAAGEAGQGVGDPARADLREVSVAELGIRNGTGDLVTLVDPERWGTDAQTAAETVRQRGMEPVAFRGPMYIGAGAVDAYVQGNQVFFSVDATDAAGNVIDPSRLVDHELFHDRKRWDLTLVDRTGAQIRREIGQERFDRMKDAYLRAYEKIENFSDMTAEDIAACLEEEICADAYAGLNWFSGADFEQAVANTRSMYEESARANPAGAREGASENGRATLRVFESGQPYVDVDVDQYLFDNLSPNEALSAARRVIRERFMGRVIGNINRAFVNGETANEYGHSANWRTTSEQKIAKSRVSTELDNLLDAGYNFRTHPDGSAGHTHEGLTGDYKYFDAVFKIGEQYYQATINIEQNKRGDRLKDVTKIENITERIAALAGNSLRTTSSSDVSKENIPQGFPSVKSESGRGSMQIEPESGLPSTRLEQRVQTAAEMAQRGALGSEIYEATGLVKMANGDIINPDTGTVERRGSEYGNGSGNSSVVDREGQSFQKKAGVAGSDRGRDQQGTVKIDWEQIGQTGKQRIRDEINRQARRSYELNDLLDLYGSNRADAVDEFARDVYSALQGSRIEAENKSKAAVPDIDALLNLMEDAGRGDTEGRSSMQIEPEATFEAVNGESSRRAEQERAEGIEAEQELAEELTDTERMQEAAEESREKTFDDILAENGITAEEADSDGYWQLVEDTANPFKAGSDADVEGDAAAKLGKGLTMARMTEDMRPSLKEMISDAWHGFLRLAVNSADTIHEIGKKTGDRAIDGYYFAARASGQAASQWIEGQRTDVMGRRTGESLNGILNPIREKGDDYYRKFQLYLLHMLNTERMGRDYSAEIAKAQANVDAILRQYPELGRYVRSGSDTELQRLVEGATDFTRQQAEEIFELLRNGETMPVTSIEEGAQLLLRARRELRKLENKGLKPVFGYEVSAEDSRAAAENLLSQHPEFEQLSKQVYAYTDDLLKYRVQAGLMTREDMDLLKRIYPHYVPTFRLEGGREAARVARRGGLRVSDVVKRAKGGNTVILPLHTSLARQTVQVMKNSAVNRLGNRILADYENNRAAVGDYVQNVEESEFGFSEDLFDSELWAPRRENVMTVLRDGKRYDVTMDEGLTYAMKSFEPSQRENHAVLKLLKAQNDLFKKLCTSYNPAFLVRNLVRDAQDAGLYSTDTAKWAKNYPRAYKEIAQNGEYWQMYKALGGSYASLLNYTTGEVQGKPASLPGRAVAKFEALNQAVEAAPRLAEFMTVLENARTRNGGELTEADMMEAFNAAAEITTNFGRGGSLTQALNRYLVPFLNPSVQGLSKFIRTATETKGAKAWTSLAIKAAALGILPTLLNGLLYGDDDEWDDLPDDMKMNYYLFKAGDGIWIKIPKGRAVAVLSAGAVYGQELLRGDEPDPHDLVTVIKDNISPTNLFTSNIFSAWNDTKLFKADDPGTTWYGGDIESQRLRNYRPGERYDERTDVISKWLGGKLNLSPKKINYLLDEYTGVFGDVVLPMLTPQAERGFVAKNFTVDVVSSNDVTGAYYDLLDELKWDRNSGDTAANAAYKYLNHAAGAVSDYYTEIRAIEADDTLTDREKAPLVRELKRALVEYQREIIATAQTYRQTAEAYVQEHPELDWNDEEAVSAWMEEYNAGQSEEKNRIDADKAADRMAAIAYRELNRETLGAEYALETYNADVYAKARSASEAGISYEDYYDFYFDTLNMQADKDANGKSINGSKKRKVVDYINSMYLTREQKQFLYELCGYSGTETWTNNRPESGPTAAGLPSAESAAQTTQPAGLPWPTETAQTATAPQGLPSVASVARSAWTAAQGLPSTR